MTRGATGAERPGHRPRTTPSWPRRQARRVAPTVPGVVARGCARLSRRPRCGLTRGSARGRKPQVSVLSPQGGAGKAGHEPVSKEAFEAAFWSQWRGHWAQVPNAKLCTAWHSRAFHSPHNQKEGWGGATKAVSPLTLVS